MTPDKEIRKLAAIMHADIKGYSRLMHEDEQTTVRTLTAYNSAITHILQQYRGRVAEALGMVPGDVLAPKGCMEAVRAGSVLC
jgi:class 3 adenylate cyclase